MIYRKRTQPCRLQVVSGEMWGKRSTHPCKSCSLRRESLQLCLFLLWGGVWIVGRPCRNKMLKKMSEKRTTNEENRVSIHHNKSSIHLPSPLYVTTFHCAASAKDCERRNKRTDRAPWLFSSVLRLTLSYPHAHITISQVPQDFILGDRTHRMLEAWS